MQPQEISISILPYGNRVAGKRWGEPHWPTVLALHGVADNAASFDNLGPYFVAEGYSLLAMDLPGHGCSDWTGRYSHPQIARDILGFIRGAQLSQPLLCVAHSFGAECLFYLASAMPRLFSKIVCIDCLGPPLNRHATEGHPREEWAALDEKYRGGLGEFVQATLGQVINHRQPRTFNSMDDAVSMTVKQRSVPPMDGYEPMRISQSAANVLLRRELRALDNGKPGFARRMDPDLMAAVLAARRYPEVDALIAAKVQSEVLWIRTRHIAQVEQAHIAEAFQYLEVADINGSHHAHLEEETAPAMAALAIRFFGQAETKSRL